MYARLAFSVAINVDPRILVVDEALAVGDEPFQRKCFAKIEQIKRAGGTILFVSHASSTIVALCDRAILLHEGKQLFSGRPKTAVGWYQKLMNAPENSERIALQISQLVEGEGQTGDAAAGPARDSAPIGGDDEPVAEPDRKLPAAPVDESGFDPNLVSQSMVVYEPNGARISNPRIETLDGEVVNLLTNGQRYRVCYDVDFDRDCENVRFRCMLKTTSGVELGGGTYPVMYRRGLYMVAGQSSRLEFAFNCNLNPGVYFFNCGLSENTHSLHRIIDALTFRVPAVEGSYSFGTIDFNIESTMRSDAD
jgi:lipopolysaccharide transport system ATP-binding protein